MGMSIQTRVAAAKVLLACWLFLSAGAAGGAQTPEVPAIPANVRAAVEAAINRVRPALVRIHVVFTEFREGRELKMQAVGSGAIITKDGFLVTNHHVAGHSARLLCTLLTREEIDAEL